jgi:hypothetical protein
VSIEKNATPPEELERKIMSSLVPKNEREHWACGEIESLRQQLEFGQAMLAGFSDRVDALEQQIDDHIKREVMLLELANKCRIELVGQIHELADHIERARGCITDPDMLKQINGQRDYALMVSDKWNQNGNPFEALAATADMNGVILCHAKPESQERIGGLTVLLYRAWEPK